MGLAVIDNIYINGQIITSGPSGKDKDKKDKDKKDKGDDHDGDDGDDD